MHTHACMHTHIQTHTHAHTHTHIHVHTHTHACTHTQLTHAHTHTQTRTHAHTHTHTYMRAHTQIHTHTHTKKLPQLTIDLVRGDDMESGVAGHGGVVDGVGHHQSHAGVQEDRHGYRNAVAANKSAWHYVQLMTKGKKCWMWKFLWKW